MKKAFSINELDEDQSLLKEIPDDMKEVGEKFGVVKNVTLFDKEQAGVVTIRFSNAVAAKKCADDLQGKYYGGRNLIALLDDGSKKFRKTVKTEAQKVCPKMPKYCLSQLLMLLLYRRRRRRSASRSTRSTLRLRSRAHAPIHANLTDPWSPSTSIDERHGVWAGLEIPGNEKLLHTMIPHGIWLRGKGWMSQQRLLFSMAFMGSHRTLR